MNIRTRGCNPLFFSDCSKMLRCKAREDRGAERTEPYVSIRGLKRNAADERFSTACYKNLKRRRRNTSLSALFSLRV